MYRRRHAASVVSRISARECIPRDGGRRGRRVLKMCGVPLLGEEIRSAYPVKYHQDTSAASRTKSSKHLKSYNQATTTSQTRHQYPQCPAHSASSAATPLLRHSRTLAATPWWLATTPPKAPSSDAAATTKVKALSCSAAVTATNGCLTTCRSRTWPRACLEERTLLELSSHSKDDHGGRQTGLWVVQYQKRLP